MAQRTRHHRPGLVFAVQAMLIALFLCLPSGSRAVEYLDPAHPLHARLAREVEKGEVAPARALMTALRGVFAPDELSGEERALNSVPLRCATGLLRAVDRGMPALDAQQMAQVAQWTRSASLPRLAGNIHLSAAGHFAIEYWTSGPDSVDITDTAPANLVPDYVERVAAELENAWSVEVDQLGFDAPQTGGLPYSIQLRAIGSFGYTELSAPSPGGTRIVLRSSYAGLPANDDPDGSEIGALRVTAAHEFRHAGQYATSGWSEAGLWIEVDAVWMEEEVHDQVNDYLRYLTTNSPITNPPLPLDDGGSASYPECVFEFWMQDRLGIAGIRDFWERRRNFPTEPILESYDAIFAGSGSALQSSFVDFALFNLQTGSRAKVGRGYSEAASFPDATLTETRSVLPARFGSTVDHVAAKFYRVDGFSTGDENVRIRIRQPGGAQVNVAVMTERDDGIRLTATLATDEPEASFVLPTAAHRIEELYLVLANGALAGSGQWIFVDVEEVAPVAPDPVVDLVATFPVLTLATGQVRDLYFELVNSGPSASTLKFAARAVQPPPAMAPRAINGSVMTLDRTDYVPAENTSIAVGIRNESTGLEFLTGATLQLPSGVSLLSGEDIVAESGLVLTFLGYSAQDSTLIWQNLGGGFGSVPPRQTAVGRVTLGFSPTLTGALALNWVLDGNGFGGAPHQATGQVLLTGPDELRLEFLTQEPMPPAFLGEKYDIYWYAANPDPINIELSRNAGMDWETIVVGTPNDGFWRWTAEGTSGEELLLRLNASGQLSAPSGSFTLLTPLDFVTMLPSSGELAGQDGMGLIMRVNASGLLPGDYPVRVDLRDDATSAFASVDVIVRVVASPVDAPAVARTRMLGAYPNPFNPATALRYELAHAGPVRIEIVDLRGRRVRSLVDRQMEAGIHATRWNGLDDRGQGVGSGTYFWRLEAESQEFVGKLSLVR